jgi:hypothetical protein
VVDVGNEAKSLDDQPALFLQLFLLQGITAGEAEEGRHDRQHDQVGDDLVADTDRCRDPQFADHRDRDQHQRDETDESGDQRQGAGNEQAGKALACRAHRIGAFGDRLEKWR